VRLFFGNRITGGCFLDRAFEMLMYNPEERYLPMGMRVKERCRILATHGIWYKEMDEEDTHSIGRSSQNMLINVYTENKKGSIRNLNVSWYFTILQKVSFAQTKPRKSLV